MNYLLLEFLGNLAKVTLFVGGYALFLGVLLWAGMAWGPIGFLPVFILGMAVLKTWAEN